MKGNKISPLSNGVLMSLNHRLRFSEMVATLMRKKTAKIRSAAEQLHHVLESTGATYRPPILQNDDAWRRRMSL